MVTNLDLGVSFGEREIIDSQGPDPVSNYDLQAESNCMGLGAVI